MLGVVEKSNPSNAHRFLSLKLYEMTEERSRWLTATQHMTRDWAQVDSAVRLVSFTTPSTNGTTTTTITTTSPTTADKDGVVVEVELAVVFGRSMMTVWEAQCRVQFDFSVIRLMSDIGTSVHDLYTVTDMLTAEVEAERRRVIDNVSTSTGIGSGYSVSTAMGGAGGGGSTHGGSTQGYTTTSGFSQFQQGIHLYASYILYIFALLLYTVYTDCVPYIYILYATLLLLSQLKVLL